MAKKAFLSYDTPFTKFLTDFSDCIKKKPSLIQQTLENVFSMRIFGNKTHGDLAEVALTEFINKYVKGYKANHVGKEQFRSKESEEDIIVRSPEGEIFPVSLKAYGVGPLQLSTNKDSSMFNLLRKEIGSKMIGNRRQIRSILADDAFGNVYNVNVISLIYDEKEMMFNIMVFDLKTAYSSVQKLGYIRLGKGRKHPVYRFYGKNNQYIFEVRYGGTGANALQRGMWTHTKNAEPFFKSLTGGWPKYKVNDTLLKMFARALVSPKDKQAKVLKILK